MLQALYALLQCGYNIDEAVQRHRLQAVAPTGFGLIIVGFIPLQAVASIAPPNLESKLGPTSPPQFWAQVSPNKRFRKHVTPFSKVGQVI